MSPCITDAQRRPDINVRGSGANVILRPSRIMHGTRLFLYLVEGSSPLTYGSMCRRVPLPVLRYQDNLVGSLSYRNTEHQFLC